MPGTMLKGMMNLRRFLFLGLALAAPALANGQTYTFSGSGSFSALPGLGYEYRATVQSSIEVSGFTPVSQSSFSPFSPGFASLIFGGRFSFVGQFHDVDSYDYLSTFSARFVDTTTGQTISPSQSGFFNGQLLAFFGVSSTISPDGLMPGGIRFSSPVTQWTTTITDGFGNPISSGPIDYIPESFTITSSGYFKPGNFLNPSPDPTCASFSCMVPGRDRLRLGDGSLAITAQSFPAAIPEPSSLLLMLAGVALLPALKRLRTS